MKLAHTRAMIDAIHSGELSAAPTASDPWFGFQIPLRCRSVPDVLLVPRNTWADPSSYDRTARKLAGLFHQNFAKYADAASDETLGAAPRLE